jgi:hypothetical protein
MHVSRPRGLRPAVAEWLVGRYPSGFRERHGDELLAWIEERGLGPLVALDLVRGALDAHLHPDLVGERRIPMAEPQRLRGVVLGVLCGYMAFALAGLGYQKLTEYDDFVAAARHHAAVGAAFSVVVGASLVALAAMLAAGVPIGLTAVRQALAGRRELIAPLAVVAVSVLWFAASLVLVAWRARGLPAGQMDSVAGIGGMLASFVLAIAVGVAAAVVAVRRASLPSRLLRFAAVAAVVATVAMVAMLAATLTWGLALRAADPALFHGADGLRDSSTSGSWEGIVALMALATAVAGAACVRGLRAARRRGPDTAAAPQP